MIQHVLHLTELVVVLGLLLLVRRVPDRVGDAALYALVRLEPDLWVPDHRGLETSRLCPQRSAMSSAAKVEGILRDKKG